MSYLKFVMKMLLLIVSLLLSSCDNTVTDTIRIDDYEFYSLQKFGKEIKIDKDVNIIIDNIKRSRKIKGPVKGIDVKTIRLVNKVKGDTLEVIVYGNKYLRIGNEFYEAKRSIISE